MYSFQMVVATPMFQRLKLLIDLLALHLNRHTQGEMPKNVCTLAQNVVRLTAQLEANDGLKEPQRS